MSAESLPISLDAFAEAIKELPLSSVYIKASELSNSIVHLRRSNEELSVFINESCDTDSEKRELEMYVAENEEVMRSMNERILRLKSEIEGRGQQWIEMEDTTTDTKPDEVQGSSSITTPATNGTIREQENGAQQELSTTRTVDTQNDQEQDHDGVYL